MNVQIVESILRTARNVSPGLTVPPQIIAILDRAGIVLNTKDLTTEKLITQLEEFQKNG